jgi:hypothetical protein
VFLAHSIARATQYLADIRFHRVLWLPPDSDPDSRLARSTPLRVTYADLGDSKGNVALFCGGLFGSRYTLALADELAKRKKVRLIWLDKPGVRVSESVCMEQKVKTWLGVCSSASEQIRY